MLYRSQREFCKDEIDDVDIIKALKQCDFIEDGDGFLPAEQGALHLQELALVVQPGHPVVFLFGLQGAGIGCDVPEQVHVQAGIHQVMDLPEPLLIREGGGKDHIGFPGAGAYQVPGLLLLTRNGRRAGGFPVGLFRPDEGGLPVLVEHVPVLVGDEDTADIVAEKPKDCLIQAGLVHTSPPSGQSSSVSSILQVYYPIPAGKCPVKNPRPL